jgi:hypothetical protein
LTESAGEYPGIAPIALCLITINKGGSVARKMCWPMTMLVSRRAVLEKLVKASEDAGGYDV